MRLYSGRNRRRVFVVVAVFVALFAAAGVTATAQQGSNTATGDAPTGIPVVPVAPEPLTSSDADSIARTYAREVAGEPAPSNQEVVETTQAAALTALFPGGSHQVAESSPAQQAALASDVYVEVLHGSFKLTNAPVPPGHPQPSGTVLTEVISAETGQVSSVALTKEAPAAATLGSLGTVRQVE